MTNYHHFSYKEKDNIMPRKDIDEYKTDPELLKGLKTIDYKDAELLKNL